MATLTLIGKKMRMTQVWKSDVVHAVTPIQIVDSSVPSLSELKEGDKVVVTGTSKGKGFQGVVKRHGFHGGPKSHGQKDRLRAPGSLGPTAPQRVVKGRKMAGRMGNARVTVRNLTVIEVSSDLHTVYVRGAVPGAPNSSVSLKLLQS